VDRLTTEQIDAPTSGPAGRQAGRQADRQAERRTDRHRQTDRQTDRQGGILTHVIDEPALCGIVRYTMVTNIQKR
jgi:hypothetical protein